MKGAIVAHDKTESQSISFFHLPRELRDMVYHYYWQDSPALKAAVLGRHSELRYQGRYTGVLGQGNSRSLNPIAKPLPQWLLANKQVLHEALKQFISKAELFRDMRFKKAGPRHPSSILDTSEIKRMTLFFCLENMHPVIPNITPKSLNKLLNTWLSIAGESLRHTSGAVRLERLRIVQSDYGHLLPSRHKWRRISRFLERFYISSLQVELYKTDDTRQHILYELVGRGSAAHFVVKEASRNPTP